MSFQFVARADSLVKPASCLLEIPSETEAQNEPPRPSEEVKNRLLLPVLFVSNLHGCVLELLFMSLENLFAYDVVRQRVLQ